MYILKNVSKHWFAYSVIFLFIYIAIYSYIRFFVNHSYTVSFESECDPLTQSCYIGCEDEACENQYYYRIIERQAKSIMLLCGGDITDCTEASNCAENDDQCTISYCDPAVSGESCEIITVHSETQE